MHLDLPIEQLKHYQGKNPKRRILINTGHNLWQNLRRYHLITK